MEVAGPTSRDTPRSGTAAAYIAAAYTAVACTAVACTVTVACTVAVAYTVAAVCIVAERYPFMPLDEPSWTYSEESFVAHGRERDGDPGLQRVYLTAGLENPNGAALRLFIEGAEMAPALAGTGVAYARAVALFDGNNAEELAAARVQWKELKDSGFAMTYWQQGANGRWEMKS
jgi:DNA polymerase III subunit chi